MMRNIGYMPGMGLGKEGKGVVKFSNVKTQVAKEGKDGKVYSGWEMFFNENVTFKEKPIVVIKEIQKEVDWMNYMDAEAIKTMMKTSGDVFAITNEEPSDPSKFIMPAVGPINNWIWVGFSEKMGKIFVM
ncbi:hypothetical protein SO802_017663 [Lithocarpus litseifolius]|uniref:G-patch domain-containing protein n=1 Tax=Lithocarpus litseifolius TaxID=425828 RepID=A0AAW2CIP3_9ROSI